MAHTELLDDNLHKKEEEKKVDAKQPVTNYFYARSIYYKGMAGMILCIVPAAFLGLVFVKLCLDQAKEALVAIRNNPDAYTESSKKRVRRGRTMGLIGLSLFILEIVGLVGYMSMH